MEQTDRGERLAIKLEQAEALLLNITGPAHDAASTLAASVREAYLCAVLDLVSEARRLAA